MSSNVRKTYMMLSETNSEIYDIDKDGHIIREYPTTHTTINVKKEKAGTSIKKTSTAVENAAYTFRFPQEFINSTNPRWIEVHHVKTIYAEYDPKDLILHSDIVRRDAYLDHSIMVCNEVRTKYKKYAYTLRDETFTIWFTSFAHPETPVNPNTLKFMVELMLIY